MCGVLHRTSKADQGTLQKKRNCGDKKREELAVKRETKGETKKGETKQGEGRRIIFLGKGETNSKAYKQDSRNYHFLAGENR